jgi:hypothetical protein
MAKAGGQLAALHELVASGPVSCPTPSPVDGRYAGTRSCTWTRAASSIATTRTLPGSVWIGDPPDALVELYRRAAGGFRIF